MKGIKLCGECGYYNHKLHKCTNGATDEGNAKDPFYADCPLVDAVEVVRCGVCRYNNHGECQKPENIGTYWDEEAYDYPCYISVEPDHFCSYGERRINDVEV